ncbi:sulfotransferase [Desulfolithobacter dissulfuricans]|uniref:Sulfotransferase n=1 Tax=Desulfolithobacter dissulfuricans TaxID=2795293 RepID=A0A915XH69_9BACT|nr:sulfotransferase [Desulfolithobacter dissulfuricans]BCO07690.1 sulfotransferase [Desulfolithobacter dissulfuricans]
MKPPIFIIGTQRSGTTLLCRILTVHPDIFIRNEIPGVTKIFSEGRTREQIMADIDLAMEESLGANLEKFLEQNKKKRWGLKDPDLTHCLGPLSAAFPDARIIFIIRDGRAVANSYIKNMWGLGVNTYYGALRWQREVNTQLEFARQHQERCYIIKFEDLIGNHVEELKKICDFIDEPYASELTNYYEHSTVITKRKQSKNVFRKPDIRLTQKWMTDLSSFQINVFETVAGETLTQLGYEPIGSKINISPPLKFWFYLQQAIIGEIQIQYQWRFKRILRRIFNR